MNLRDGNFVGTPVTTMHDEAPLRRGVGGFLMNHKKMKSATMTVRKAPRRCLGALSAALLFVAGAHVAAQAQNAPLHVMRSATIERPLLVMSTGAAAPGEVYVGDVRIRVAIEGDFRVYRVFHKGTTRTLHVSLDTPLHYVAFDPRRNRFERLSHSLRVELEDDGLLDQIVTAVGGTGGKAYPMLGFAIVQLSPQDNPVEAARTLEALPGVLDVRLMVEGPRRVPQ